MTRSGDELKPPFIWAHRGASANAPENTLAAFAAALEAGADGIELDIQLTRDGVPVVLHDDSLDRTTDLRGALRRQALREVCGADAGSWFAPSFAGEKIPLLKEVLDWAGRRLRLNLELKDPAAARPVLDLLCLYPQVAVIVSSFNRRLLRQLRSLDADLSLAVLSDSRLWRLALTEAVRLGAESFNPRVDLVGPRLLAACHRRGLAVVPWTVDGADRVRRMQRLGVDGLFCNDPLAARRSLQRWPGGIFERN